jgi:DNA helicase II / ATP-dependent DNA helicase PcrA
MNLNPQQQAVIDWGLTGSGSANVIARAGCGKTSTLIELARAVPGRVFLGAFNKAIADELQSRISSNPRATASTMHSIGYRIWRENFRPKCEIDGHKVRNIAYEYFPFAKAKGSPERKVVNAICDVVGFAKQAGFGISGAYGGPGPFENNEKLWSGMIEYHDLRDEIPGDMSDERFIGYCVRVYAKSLEQCNQSLSLLDFNDMILAPLYYSKSWKSRMFDWVMVDECQDTNAVRRMLATHILKDGGRMVCVGDPRQCQPPGTMVTLEGGDAVPIEDLVSGIGVVTLDQRAHVYVGTTNQARKVTATSCRHYRGDLISVTAGTKSTRATPTHKFFVRWEDRSTTTCVVYLMRRGDDFRVGWCQLFEKSGSFHLGQRARLEKADAAWIISVHNSRAEASMYESIASTKYGIPLMLFESCRGGNVNLYTTEFLSEFWDKMRRSVNLKHNALRLLESAGRDIDFPIYTGKNGRQGRTTCFETQACNMISGMMSVPVYEPDNTRKPVWQRAFLSKEQYDGPVYSLDVANHHNYVADGILTKNSIYGFAGASSDAMGLIKRDREMVGAFVELPLTVTYRCPKSVVALANTWVPDLQAHESAPEGIILNVNHDYLWKTQYSPEYDVILCRNTRPLVGIARRLRKIDIPCMVEGNSAKGLLMLAEKWGDVSMTEFCEFLSQYRTDEVRKAVEKEDEEKAAYISEKCSILFDIASDLDNEDTTRKLVNRIESLFGMNRSQSPEEQTGILHLCSIHRSKGREWDRVIIVGANRYQPSKWAETKEEKTQEENLMYVSVTRAKCEVVRVNVPVPRPGETEGADWWEL